MNESILDAQCKKEYILEFDSISLTMTLFSIGMAHQTSFGRFHESSINSPRKMHNRYFEAMNELKYATRSKVCLTLTSKSQGEDIIKQLPTNKQMITVHYIRNGKPYMQAIFSGEECQDK